MIVTSLLILTAFFESPAKSVPPTEQVQVVSSPPQAACAKDASGDSQGIANLPFAMGRQFATLDAYLTYLECYAQPVDHPWWKEIGPGLYRHMATATNAPNEVATRAELMKRFGFIR